MRGMKRHEDFASGTIIGNAVGRPHYLLVESGIQTIAVGQTPVGDGPNFGVVFDVNTAAQYHSMRTDDSVDFYFGTDNYTIECWVNILSGSNPQTDVRLFFLSGIDEVPSGSGNFIALTKVYILDWDAGSDTLGLYKDAGPGYTRQPYSAGTWAHVAVTKQSGYEYFFINGVQVDSDIADENYTGTSISWCGEYGSTDTIPDNFQVRFYLDDIRITRQALYTANFTPISRQTIYNTANTMAFFSSGTITDGYAFDDITTDSQTVVIESGYAPAGYVTIT